MSGRGPEGGPLPEPAVVDARRVEGPGAPDPAEFSYSVSPRRPAPAARVRPAAAATGGDKRHDARQRTKLRTGKIVDVAGRFVSECLVFDRSAQGGRLRLPAGMALPGPTFQFYDDQSGVLLQADVAWQTGREAGVRFRPTPVTPRARALAEDMRRRYYAVPR